MSILTSKWMLLLLIPIVVVFVLLLVGQKSVKSETIINAQPDAVWALLTKTDGYPDWNPVMQSAKGNLVEGEKIVYLFKQDENVQYDVPITVKKIVDGKHLNQGVERNPNGDHPEVNNCGIAHWEQVFYATVYG